MIEGRCDQTETVGDGLAVPFEVTTCYFILEVASQMFQRFGHVVTVSWRRVAEIIVSVKGESGRRITWSELKPQAYEQPGVFANQAHLSYALRGCCTQAIDMDVAKEGFIGSIAFIFSQVDISIERETLTCMYHTLDVSSVSLISSPLRCTPHLFST